MPTLQASNNKKAPGANDEASYVLRAGWPRGVGGTCAGSQLTDGVVTRCAHRHVEPLLRYPTVGAVIAVQMAIDASVEPSAKDEIVQPTCRTRPMWPQPSPVAGSTPSRSTSSGDRRVVLVDRHVARGQRQEEDLSRDRPGSSDLTGKLCSIHRALDLRYLRTGQRHRLSRRQERQRLVLSHRHSPSAAPCTPARRRQRLTKNGGKVLGEVNTPINTSDFSSFLLQAQASKANHRSRQCRRGHHPTPSNGPPVQYRQGRPRNWPACFSLHLRRAFPRTEGLSLTEAFYWDQRQDSAPSQAFAAKNNGRCRPASRQLLGRTAVLNAVRRPAPTTATR